MHTAFQDLNATRALFTKRRHISSISSFWFRSTEVTVNRDAWHPHDNLMVFGNHAELENVLSSVADRWAQCARESGVYALETAQYVEYAHSPHHAVNYALKSPLTLSEGNTPGQTIGDLKRAAFHGDDVALSRFHEFEEFLLSRRTRFVSHGAGFRTLDLG